MMRRSMLRSITLLTLALLALAGCAPASAPDDLAALITPDGTRPTFIFFFTEN